MLTIEFVTFIICIKNNISHIILFLANGDFCHLLITFANSLDPDQESWSGSKLFDTLESVPERFF